MIIRLQQMKIIEHSLTSKLSKQQEQNRLGKYQKIKELIL